ncbi:hypothetical protein HLK66_25020 [Niallia circulans]|uniref:hypothetical protein n=1 Tax=Niallia circulans TaxID=1397 RepID=UPI00148F98BE|nr:hypothetical protein [Niallia circulans]QJX64590.1 hypothetical protein HLK66_25020 [Niallia circulans]
MYTKSLTKVGYLVHLSSDRDDSVDQDFKRRVLEELLKQTYGLFSANSLSYKSNPLVAQLFMKQLKDDGIGTIVVHDPLIFEKDVIKLFVEENFHFLLVEVNRGNTKYRIKEISNSDLKGIQEKFKANRSNWISLNSKYKRQLVHNEKTAKWLNGIINEMEKKTM